MKTIVKIAIFAVIAAAALGLWYSKSHDENNLKPVQSSETQIQTQSQNQELAESPVARANYTCDGGKTIDAAFYKGKDVPVEAGQPPVPTGRVKLVFGDGTNMELAQTISADGGRYANADESFIFWDKGGTALVLENGAEANYKNCVNSSEKTNFEETSNPAEVSKIQDQAADNNGCQGSPIPQVDGLPYFREARDKIIKFGWQPLQTNFNDKELFNQAKTFFYNGYKEVDDCSGTGMAYCRFLFKDGCSNIIIVVTAGEEIPDMKAFATVDNIRVMTDKEKTSMGL